jgi:hypothetical protein
MDNVERVVFKEMQQLFISKIQFVKYSIGRNVGANIYVLEEPKLKGTNFLFMLKSVS